MKRVKSLLDSFFSKLIISYGYILSSRKPYWLNHKINSSKSLEKLFPPARL